MMDGITSTLEHEVFNKSLVTIITTVKDRVPWGAIIHCLVTSEAKMNGKVCMKSVTAFKITEKKSEIGGKCITITKCQK